MLPSTNDKPIERNSRASIAQLGNDVWVGAGATISDHVSIGDRARVLLSAVVAYDVPEGEMVSGFYAMPHRQWKQVWRRLKEAT